MDESDSSNNGWFSSGKSAKKEKVIPSGYNKKWIEVNGGNKNDELIPLSMCRLGGVQKTESISKCVPRVQGPIFYDHRIKMRGSATFMAAGENGKNVNGGIVPNNI